MARERVSVVVSVRLTSVVLARGPGRALYARWDWCLYNLRENFDLRTSRISRTYPVESVDQCCTAYGYGAYGGYIRILPRILMILAERTSILESRNLHNCTSGRGVGVYRTAVYTVHTGIFSQVSDVGTVALCACASAAPIFKVKFCGRAASTLRQGA